MYELICQEEPKEPCILSSDYKLFTACLSCLTALETRFCNGTFEPSWKLCPRHQEMLSRKECTLNEDMLGHLRENVYYGHIPKPALSKCRVHEQGLGGSVRVKQDIRLWPQPTICFAHKGCVFSNDPDWKIDNNIAIVKNAPNADFTATPTSASTSAFTTSVLAPQSAQEKPEREGKDLKNPALITEVQSLIADAILVKGHERTLHQNIVKLEERYGLTTSLWRSLFFKRCNGTYANAAGEQYYKPNEHGTNQRNHNHNHNVPDQEQEGEGLEHNQQGDETKDVVVVVVGEEKEKHEDSPNRGNIMNDPDYDSDHNPMITVRTTEAAAAAENQERQQQPKIPFMIQLGREKLVRESVVSKDSLAITMFAMNNQIPLP